MPALAAAYGIGDCGCGRRAAAEEIVMLFHDFRAFIPGNTLFTVRNVAVRFPSIDAGQPSSLVSSTEASPLMQNRYAALSTPGLAARGSRRRRVASAFF